MRVLITGAAGFIGSHLADALVADGHEVVGIDNLSTGRRANFPSGGHLVVGDITKPMEFLNGRWDVIYHCAASYKDRTAWEQDARTNVLGTIHVVREAKAAGARLVYFQTSLCYGLAPRSPVRLYDPLQPTGSYAVSKTAGEQYIRDSGVDYVSLRLANMYGPRNLSGPVPTFWKRLSEGEPCTVVDSRRDFVYVGDLVQVAEQAARTGHGAYHVASGRDVSIAELYDAVGAAMGIEPPPVERIPRGPDDAASILLDPFETQVTYGWEASTPLALGVAEAVNWYAANGVSHTFTHLSMKG